LKYINKGNGPWNVGVDSRVAVCQNPHLMKTTISDIARRVGCSPATVSRALNATGGVEPALKRRILVAARALDGGVSSSDTPRRGRPRGSLGKTGAVEIIVFRPGEVEPLVVSANTLSVGPLTETSTNLFFSPRFRLVMDFYRHVINGIVSVLSASGIKTLQRESGNLLDASLLEEVRVSKLCGVLVMGTPDPQVATFAAQCPCPVVLVDILGLDGLPVVAIDNTGAAALALNHLLGLGHRRIGFVGNPDNPSFRERYDTYLGGMDAAGLSGKSAWHYDGSSHIRGIAEGLQPMLKASKRPTAFLCACDHYAIGVFEAAQIAGLRIPEDLSVVGIDDIDAASLTKPPLTTIRVPMVQLGACAADLLLRVTSKERSREILQNCEIRCRTELVVRESTAAPVGGRKPRHVPPPPPPAAVQDKPAD
jgi:LacI family transcriptional regulator